MVDEQAVSEAIAQQVAETLGFDRWEDDAVTREIGSAENLVVAAQRLHRILQDAVVGLEAVLARLR